MTGAVAQETPIGLDAPIFVAGHRGMVGSALLLAVLIGGWLWTKDPPYSLLFAIQDEKDGGQIIDRYYFVRSAHTRVVPVPES